MKRQFYLVIKRCFDIISALSLFILLIPLFALICLLVRIKMGSPIFYRQVRSGKNRKQFSVIKFRTMTNQTDENGNLLADEFRQTKFGNFLRSTSLDELPELLSIVKGDMSVIGPRPLPIKYNEYFNERELKRFEVRSGLLPPDSVESSAIISWDKQLEYEADYAENISLHNDIKIFFSAIKILFKRNETNYGSFVRLPLDEERISWNTVKR
ncbi:MAG: sugar transferase [Clostridia bacterium]|nr:sugar transferase [Clostridia bacterium]